MTPSSEEAASATDQKNDAQNSKEGRPDDTTGPQSGKDISTKLIQTWSKSKEKISESHKFFSELFDGLRSKDALTRQMTYLFFISTLMLCIMIYSGWKYLSTTYQSSVKKTKSFNQGERLSEFIQKQAEVAKQKALLAKLGTFRIELKATTNDRGVINGVTLAEIEIVLECDSRTTRDFVEDNIVQTRDQIVNVFTALDTDEILSREGKKKLKEQIIEKLNLWFPNGKVLNLYFSLLILS